MSDWTRKTRSAGPPAKDKRKVDKEPAKVPSKRKVRNYELVVTQTYTTIYTYTHYYGTRAARE